jgi:uncharacterized protein (TIGR02147 family)
MILEHSNYRTFLKSVIVEKQRANPAFSMRAFAKHIGLGQSAVSQVLSGKKNLSFESASRIAQKLKLEEKDAEYFRILVQIETTRDPEVKKALVLKAQTLNSDHKVRDLSVDLFSTIADWYHAVIENLTEIVGFTFTPSEISKTLGISKHEAELAIERLLRLEIIEKDPKHPNKYRRVPEYTLTTSDVPNKALRLFHKQMLEKTIESLETQSPKEKFIGTETIAVSKDSLPQIFELADEFLKKVVKISESSKLKTDVYHLAVQFFNLTPKTQTRFSKGRKI